jgi:PAS domain S-box-containing protein
MANGRRPMSEQDRRLDLDGQRLRAFLRAGSFSLTYVARDGTVLEINAVGCQRLGMPREQVLGRSVFELLPSMAAQVRARIEHVFDTKEAFKADDDVALPTGVLHFKSSLDPVLDDAGRVIAVLIQSIEATAEHALAHSLVRANEKLSAIFGHSPYLIVAYDRGGFVRYINRVNPGFLMEQVVGTHSHAFMRAEFHSRYDEALRLVFEEGQTSKFEFQLVSGAWWEATMVPVKHEDRVEQAISFSLDITERRRAEHEQARLREQMQHTQKLESLGVLAGGIAHDFNNLLLVIAGNAELAQQEIGSGNPASEYLDDALGATKTAADLCKQMLAYAGRGRFVIEAIDLSRLVAEMTQLIGVSISKGAHLTRDLTPGLPAVEGDSSQLRQVVLNLITNASDAIGERQGVIAVRTRLVRLDGDPLVGAVATPPIEPGDYVLFEVEDTGCGIDDATRARMFEPFFSTKASGRGLGLSATLGIIRQHRGVILVDSTPGVGTAIRIYFPALANGDVPSPVRSSSERVAAGRGLILVVDDEEGVRKLASRALTQAGYEVETSADGREALACQARHGDRLRLVLLDLTMPELSGQDTLLALRERNPTLPIIVMSGYTESSLRASDIRFLAKPFRATDLVATVAELLKDQLSR